MGYFTYLFMQGILDWKKAYLVFSRYDFGTIHFQSIFQARKRRCFNCHILSYKSPLLCHESAEFGQNKYPKSAQGWCFNLGYTNLKNVKNQVRTCFSISLVLKKNKNYVIKKTPLFIKKTPHRTLLDISDGGFFYEVFFL